MTGPEVRRGSALKNSAKFASALILLLTMAVGCGGAGSGTNGGITKGTGGGGTGGSTGGGGGTGGAVTIAIASSLPLATTHTAYTATITASGGTSPYTFSITAGSLPSGLTLAPGGQITGVPLAATTATFTVQAQDSASHSGTQQLTLTVSDTLVVGTSLPFGQVGTAYSTNLSVAGGLAPFTWTLISGSLPAGLTLSTAGAVTGTPLAVGTSTFTVKVQDSANNVATQQLSIAVSNITITSSAPPAATVDVPFSTTLDANGGIPPYTWVVASGSLPPGLAISPSQVLGTPTAEITISGTPTAAGTYTFTISATDSVSLTATKVLTIVVANALTVTSTSAPMGAVGSPYSFFLAASGGALPYGWSLSGSLPAGLTLGSNGLISGTPTATGNSLFTVTVTDAAQRTASQALTITINPALVVTTTMLPSGGIGTAYSATLNASGGVPPYTWTGTPPFGLSLSSSGQISGTPTSGGTASFTAQVKDAANNTANSPSLSITISQLVVGASLPTGTTGVLYNAQLNTTGGTQPYSYVFSGFAIPGLTTTAGGLISGTPTSAGTYPFSVQVTDALAVTATQNLSITIAGPLQETTPTPAAPGMVGASYSQLLTASGGVQPYTWSSSGTLPPGLSVSTGGLVSGTPTAAGSYAFTVKVTDAASSTASGPLTIDVAAPLVTNLTLLPAGTVGTAYLFDLSPSGGTPPYAWSLASGSLPPGLVLSGGGQISGTPTTVGTTNFSLTLDDSAGRSITQATSISVAPNLVITTGVLPPGTVGTFYSSSLGASGGNQPFTWTLTSGSLPPGLSLSSGGTISGTPTASASSSFTVQVSDSSGDTATQALSIGVSGKSTGPGPALGITTTFLPAAPVLNSYATSLTGTGGTPPYTWSVIGSLPPGLSMSSLGTISGNATTTGPNLFSIQVTDSVGNVYQQPFSLAVVNFNPGGKGTVIPDNGVLCGLTDTNVHLPPNYTTSNLPPYGQWTSDPVFGCPMMRLVAGQHEYSEPSAISQDDQYVVAQPTGSGTAAVYRVVDGTIACGASTTKFNASAGTEPRWSVTEPNIIYSHCNLNSSGTNNSICRFDVNTCTRTNWDTFDIAHGYDQNYNYVDFCSGENDGPGMTETGDFLCVGLAPTGTNTGENQHMYQLSTKHLYPAINGSNVGVGHNVDYASITPVNHNILVAYDNGWWLFNGITGTQIKQAFPYSPHSDRGEDSSGNEIAITQLVQSTFLAPGCTQREGFVSVNVNTAALTTLTCIDNWFPAVPPGFFSNSPINFHASVHNASSKQSFYGSIDTEFYASVTGSNWTIDAAAKTATCNVRCPGSVPTPGLVQFHGFQNSNDSVPFSYTSTNPKLLNLSDPNSLLVSGTSTNLQWVIMAPGQICSPNMEPLCPNWQSAWGRYFNEVIVCNLDGSGCRRLAHTRSMFRGYYSSPKVSISRDGKYAVINTNFAQGDIYNDQSGVDVVILKVR